MNLIFPLKCFIMSSMTTWRNRIIGQAEVDPAILQPNPNNWRRHPENQQEVMRDVLDSVGWAQQVVVNKQTGNLVDGHLRLQLALERKETSMPVLYVDLSPAEEKLVLATLDPIGALAETDKEMLDSLLRQVDVAEASIQEMLANLADESGLYEEMPEGRVGDESAKNNTILLHFDSTTLKEFDRMLIALMKYFQTSDQTATVYQAVRHSYYRLIEDLDGDEE